MTRTEFIRCFVDFAKQAHLYLKHFPKDEKFALALQIKKDMYELYNLSTELEMKHFKKTSLNSLLLTLQRLRLNLFLAKELGYFEFYDGKRFRKDNDNAKQRGLHRYAVLGIKLSPIKEHIKSLALRLGA